MKMTKRFGQIAAVAVAALAFAPFANANMITNGSFEADFQGAGSWNIYPSLTGWSGGAGGIELRNNVAGAAYDGVNYVELDTTGNSLAYQGIATSLGTQYTLSFAYSPREGISAASNPIEVWWNGVLLDTRTGVGSGSGNNWSVFSYNVTGNAPTSTVLFRAVGTSDSLGGSLDAVSLVSAVPEPEMLGMLGLGLLGLGFAKRRKQN